MKQFFLTPAIAFLFAAAISTASAQVVWTEGVIGAPPSILVNQPVFGQGYPGHRIMPGVVLPGAAENRPWLQAMPYSPYFYPAQVGGGPAANTGGIVNAPTIDPRFWAGGINSQYYPGGYPAAGYGLPPMFHWPGSYPQQMASLEALMYRAQILGTAGVNTAKIADTLEKGFPKIGPETLDVSKNKDPKQGIILAGNDPKPAQPVSQTPPNGNGNGNGNGVDPNLENGFKQTIDEINKVFRTEADLIRSLDIGALRRGYGPYGAYGIGYPYGAPPPGSINGYGNGYGSGAPVSPIYDGSTVVMNGRTGLEVVLLAPEVLDALKIPRDQGLLVKEVYPKTPAEGAGFKRGDILLEFNGKKVPSDFQLFVTKIMTTVKSDVPVTSLVLRGKERLELSPMTVTDKRVLPPLPHERLPELTSVIQVVPGINTENPAASVTPGTNRVPELRIIRNGLVTEIIPVYRNQK